MELALGAATVGLPESPQLEARRAGAGHPGRAAVGGGTLMALLRPPYRERTLRLWLVYALSAMLMYFLVSWLPVILAAWAPAAAGLMIALSLLLHLEDG